MSDGAVTRCLVELIARQVADHGLVVWHDPEAAYTTVAERFRLPGSTLARYEGSFLELRRKVDDLLDGLQPPRLVVYVPMDQARTEHALIEFEAAGAVTQPGQQPPARNTRLSLVARNTLRPVVGEENAAAVEK